MGIAQIALVPPPLSNWQTWKKRPQTIQASLYTPSYFGEETQPLGPFFLWQCFKAMFEHLMDYIGIILTCSPKLAFSN